MSTNLISFPMRLGPSGAIVTRDDDSAEYYDELLAALILTQPGERDQVPLFGINDPTFTEIDAHELTYKIELFGPPVKVLNVKVKQVSDTKQIITVQYMTLVDTDTNNLG